MSPLLLLVAAVALAATGPISGVHRLPITRTTVELDWRWVGADPFGKHHPSQQPLVQRFHERKNTNEKHSKKVARTFSKNILSGEDDIDFWSIYTAPIRLGNPPLNLDTIIDTSWSPFFVPSANCTYDAREINNCIIHPLYNSSLSSTYRADLSPCKMVYWGVEGIQTYGRISEDSLHASGLEITNQVFEEATQWHPGYLTSDYLFDTVLGLALHPTYDEWGNFSAPGPFQNLIKQQLLRENIFSLTLPRTDNERGEIVFGGLPENVTREGLIEVPLNDTRRGEGDDLWDFYTSNGWQVLVENIAMTPASSKKFLPILAKQHIAVVTSSYPYIGLPEEAAKKANQFIGLNNGGTWVNCNTRSSLPDIVIAFSAEKRIKLTARDYLLEVYDDIYGRLKCVSTFVSLGDSGNSGIILLGSPFLNGLYSVFDADRKSISFGNQQLQRTKSYIEY
ncbi:acid protease [Zopfia rhizophila CBS 207.26]|uniref:Acid protease n=1 Tax=Zopfia rhizophila CBS 207.26 TaxID=1314779 RepID=A0A6A6DHE5_9PEZI|nr:acid protease [Zopfia rhizophila CBS 207.26]